MVYSGVICVVYKNNVRRIMSKEISDLEEDVNNLIKLIDEGFHISKHEILLLISVLAKRQEDITQELQETQELLNEGKKIYGSFTMKEINNEQEE